MSNDKPEDHETTVAHYQRADARRLPTSPAGQAAAVEGMATAHGMVIVDHHGGAGNSGASD